MSTAAVQVKQSDVKEPASSASLFAAPERRAFILSLLLIVATLAIYNQATHASFVNFDDDRYVTENQHVHAGLTWATGKWALTSIEVANWQPLTWISYALDYQLFRLNPAGYHFTNIFLHSLSAGLLFFLLWRATRRLGLSFFVAMVFAVHPLNVESVVWISERKNVLSTMFFLATLAAYAWYAQKPDWKRYVAVASLFICALASKPMVVTLPFVLLLQDYWPLRRISGCTRSEEYGVSPTSVSILVLEKLPFFVLSAASCVITMHAQKVAGAVGGLPFPFAVRLKNATCSYALYIGKAVWPTKLALLYPYPGHALETWKAVLAALLLVAISALVVKYRSRGYLPVGWFWFLGTLVPVIGLVQVGNQAMADRFTYMPFIGLFIMITWGTADLFKSIRLGLPSKVTVAACVVIALAVAAYRQAGYWHDSLTLWGHALAVTSNNFVAEDQFGEALVELGRVDEAYPHFVRAARLQPADPVSHLDIGAYLQQHGHLAEALPQYELAASLTTDTLLLATTLANEGSVYSDLGNDARAHAAFERSIQLDPYRYNTWVGMGLLAEREGKPQDAMRDFVRSIQLQPNGQAYLELGRILAQSGRNADALVALDLALKIAPDLSEAKQAADALRQQVH